MERKERYLTDIILRDLKKGFWKTADAARYAPMLFPLVDPGDNVRNALTAINCSEEKDQRLKLVRSFINKEKDARVFFQEFEDILSGNKDRLINTKTEDDGARNYRDIIMMLLATNFASQKSRINITTDVTALFKSVYIECEQCIIKQQCKGAAGILTEYIVRALKELNVDLIKNN